MNRIECLKHKIIFLEDVNKGLKDTYTISNADEYCNVIKEELRTDGIATFTTDGIMWDINKQKVPQYLDKERMRYNDLKRNRRNKLFDKILSLSAIFISLFALFRNEIICFFKKILGL